ncbi:hypothetical protein [Streptomyces sp. NPDC046862]|uniref:hypothetical protein n=1 Tax=Streptomyces sp. NPDC046862 TaxID=3154603 RepID=UPI0034544A6E
MLPPAKSMDDMRTVVTNSTVDGVLSATLALLIADAPVPSRRESGPRQGFRCF